MKRWKDLSWPVKVALGIALILLATQLPELSFLIDAGGVDLALAFLGTLFAPAIVWLVTNWAYLRSASKVVVHSLAERRWQRTFVLSASFSLFALGMWGSAPLALVFWAPFALVGAQPGA